MDIRNIAIIAHVDHGKTTLVDAMLKQTHTFRDNQKEMGETLIMDSNELEKERGITILSKNTAVFYKNIKINIIDTPGHADFGGEVERIMNMASGALLLVDAAEGPLPQTKFVLKKALESHLKIIVFINKIDKKDARPKEVLHEIENLFLELSSHESHLSFTVLYGVGRDGAAFLELPHKYNVDKKYTLEPLFDTILKDIPNSHHDEKKPFQMLVSTLDYDSYVGKICIGKVNQGILHLGEEITLIDENIVLGKYKATKLFISVGLRREETSQVVSGDIAAVAGIDKLTIGQTISHPDFPRSLPKIKIEDPTIKITIGPNTSPLSGKEGKLCSSTQIKERLLKEKEINLGLHIESDPDSAHFIVAGRGELHLAVLLETMRREGFEMQVSKPQVIYKEIEGVMCEPYEEVTIDVDSHFIGIITEELGNRKGEMQHMHPIGEVVTRFVYKISSKNLLGIRNSLLTATRGTALISTYFLGYFPKVEKVENFRNGALIAIRSGIAHSYGITNAQERGNLFIGPGVQIYEGMVVGISNRVLDIDVNVCKEKKQTNVRSENADIAIQLTPAIQLTLEQALDFLADDELLEITPKNLRIRKKYLDSTQRKVMQRKG